MPSKRNPGHPTPRALDVLRVYARAHEQNRPCPSMREVAEALGLSTASVVAIEEQLRALERCRCIQRVRRQARSVCVTSEGWAYLGREAA